MITVHPTAIISEGATIGEGTSIGPYTIIGPKVVIGKGNEIGSHVVIEGNTIIGDYNRIFPFASIGFPPQDMSYRSEPTEVVIGHGNIIREGVTIHRGTVRGKGVTRVGNENYLMAYCHIAHDCQIGNHVIMANYAGLAGHVTIGDFAIIGGIVGVHQYVRIGRYAFIGGFTAVTRDIPPFMLCAGERGKLYGPNVVGLKRANFKPETISALKKAYKIIFCSGLILKAALAQVKALSLNTKEVEELISFLEAPSRQGITR